MSKPKSDTPASKTPSSSSNTTPTTHDPQAELLRIAQQALAAGIDPRHDARAALRSVQTIISLRTLDAEGLGRLGETERKFAEQVRLDFDAASVDAEFIRPAQAIGARFEAMLDGSPSDRRKIGTISAEDRDRVNRTARAVARAKNAVASAARSRFMTEAAEAFGRGMSFNHDNPADVHDALQQFLAGADKYPQLVEIVGIAAKELAELEASRQEMNAILQRKQLREGGKATGSDALKLEQLALESWLDLYRGRCTWKLEDEPARERVLGLLPRAPERRKRAAAQPPAETPKAQPDTPKPAAPPLKTAVE